MTVAHQYSTWKNEKLQYRDTQFNNQYTTLYRILQRSPIHCEQMCMETSYHYHSFSVKTLSVLCLRYTNTA